MEGCKHLATLHLRMNLRKKIPKTVQASSHVVAIISAATIYYTAGLMWAWTVYRCGHHSKWRAELFGEQVRFLRQKKIILYFE